MHFVGRFAEGEGGGLAYFFASNLACDMPHRPRIELDGIPLYIAQRGTREIGFVATTLNRLLMVTELRGPVPI